MNNTTGNNTTLASFPEFEVTWDKIVIAVILYIITLVTIFGNILVLIAVRAEKKLRTTFNYYIVNLAITDIAVAVTAMSFKATYTILGYWPFGEVLCAVWIFFDYGMTFVSVFTLILISVDRFWCVTWSVNYRKYHTKRKCIISIICVWVFMLILWLPPWIVDRLRYSDPDVCFWDPSLNREFVFIVATLGHHGPFCTIIFCYINVFIFMHKRTKVGAPGTTNIAVINTTIATNSDAGSASCSRAPPNTPRFNRVRPYSPPPSKDCSLGSTNVTLLRVPNMMTSNNDQNKSVAFENRISRDRKVFVTLTYIIFGYAILWLPFHVCFDVSIVDPNLVPERVFDMAFWMAYFNSTINPILYNFSSPEFRRTYRQILGRGKC